jgi:xylose isomerase
VELLLNAIKKAKEQEKKKLPFFLHDIEDKTPYGFAISDNRKVINQIIDYLKEREK